MRGIIIIAISLLLSTSLYARLGDHHDRIDSEQIQGVLFETDETIGYSQTLAYRLRFENDESNKIVIDSYVTKFGGLSDCLTYGSFIYFECVPEEDEKWEGVEVPGIVYDDENHVVKFNNIVIAKVKKSFLFWGEYNRIKLLDNVISGMTDTGKGYIGVMDLE